MKNLPFKSGASLTLFLGACGSLLAAAADKPSRPNVIFIMPDQWRASALGFAGDANIHTPNLDRLAREGINCLNAVSGMPVCCPARATLMTGRRPLTHGVFMNDVPLDPHAATLGKSFRAAGYDTAYIGKWHLDGNGRSNFIPRERRQGFDYWKVLECTHSYNNSHYYADGPEKLKWDGYDVIAQTRDAENYLRARGGKPGKPFFLFLAWGPPHDPYHTAPEKFRALYSPARLILPPNVPEAAAAQTRRALAGYYAHCSAMDECVGALRATLEETGLARDTLVVFTSDHGDMLGAHGGRNKQQPYDESIRVPLLLHWPSGFGGEPRSTDALIATEDLMPTLLGLCGIRIPESVEGIDYSGHLRGGANPSDGAVLISCASPFGQWNRARGGKEYRGIRTSRHTYVRDLGGPWLLFDNQKDPWQLQNLAGRPEFAALQAELDAMLKKKLAAARDEFLPGDAYIKKWGYKVDATGTVPYAPAPSPKK
jgi:arylsulfatase A-like enzyme